MPAYLIAKISVDEPTQLKPYQEAAQLAIDRYGARFIVRGGASETMEGLEDPRRTVILEFPSLADAKAYWHSPEYAAARRLREGIGTFEVAIIDGYQ